MIFCRICCVMFSIVFMNWGDCSMAEEASVTEAFEIKPVAKRMKLLKSKGESICDLSITYKEIIVKKRTPCTFKIDFQDEDVFFQVRNNDDLG